MAQNISKKLSQIGSNIKKIRQVKKMSQADFSNLFNLARPSVGAYEEGRSEPKIETIIAIANYFRISVDVLLTKELTVSEIFSLDRLNQKLNEVHQSRDSRIDSAHIDTNEGISLVRLIDTYDYIVKYETADFILNLQRIHVPYHSEKSLMAFEMNGSEMEYNQQGLHHGDLLVGEHVHQVDPSIHIDQILAVVEKNSIFTRRLKAIEGNLLTFITDDPNYDALTIDKDDILQLWHVKMVISKYLNKPTFLEERVLKLESSLQALNETVKK
ncbi:helix-turn-helix domain-containing protein [Reichenbachiella sp.]|uniref:helix-turn-helix domain-containing protein n=1 Tax=Reichenbachiella sp. TaxID=2184521 RepID=UPI003BB075FB